MANIRVLHAVSHLERNLMLLKAQKTVQITVTAALIQTADKAVLQDSTIITDSMAAITMAHCLTDKWETLIDKQEAYIPIKGKKY